MEHIPAGKKVIEISICVTSPNGGFGDIGSRKIVLLADKTTSLGDVLAIAVDAVNTATGSASGV